VASLVLALGLLWASATVVPDTIGTSAEGRPIEAFAIGHGSQRVAIIGGIHGAYEINTSWLVWDLLHSFEEHPEAVPEGLTLLLVPEANPDGLANGTRFLADGVDPNRNWPTQDWSPDAFEPGAWRLLGGGGEGPLSEPETRALAAWIEQTQPMAVLSYHSAGGMVMGGQGAEYLGLVEAYAAGATGYLARDWMAYPVTGDFVQWCEEMGVPALDLELWDHTDTDFDRNMAGLQIMLETLAVVANESY
jgi:protein MpaA